MTVRVSMYDAVEVNQIPANALAVAGYVGGSWPTFASLAAKFPNAHRVSIAINASEDADILDIETGDATPADAPGWFRRQRSLGKQVPGFYANSSTMPLVLEALASAKIFRHEYLVWSAHFTGVPHIEPGSDATQYWDKALGRNLDVSLCEQWFFGAIAPKPKPKPKPGWVPNDEINWEREWDRIIARKTIAAHLRRLYLKARMVKRIALIKKLAGGSTSAGWKIRNRRDRCKKLEARVK